MRFKGFWKEAREAVCERERDTLQQSGIQARREILAKVLFEIVCAHLNKYNYIKTTVIKAYNKTVELCGALWQIGVLDARIYFKLSCSLLPEKKNAFMHTRTQ